MSIDITVYVANEKLISYKYSQWRTLFSCLLAIGSPDNLVSNPGTLKMAQKNQQRPPRTFSIKILIQSFANGIQSVDSPHLLITSRPLARDTDNDLLTGLSSFSDYSIRVIFATSFPFKQAASKSAVYLWTPEKLTCCVFNDLVVTSQPFSKTISVKWKLPEHLSGRVRQIKLFLASYSFSDCASFIYLVNNIGLARP